MFISSLRLPVLSSFIIAHLIFTPTICSAEKLAASNEASEARSNESNIVSTGIKTNAQTSDFQTDLTSESNKNNKKGNLTPKKDALPEKNSPSSSKITNPSGAFAIPGNPGADNVITGTGKLGELINIPQDSGVRLGGIWIGQMDTLMSGNSLTNNFLRQKGGGAGDVIFDQLALLDLQLDMEKIVGLHGASFGSSFLWFDGQNNNYRAGVLTGYNGLSETGPSYNRVELYQLWWRQSLFDDKWIFRVGKSIPTFDFNNVTRRLPLEGEKQYVSAVTALLFTPIFVNPSILGVMPGYWNSAWGVTTTVAPNTSFYASYGIYDGSLALGRQTGTVAGPNFSNYFTIGELGTSWVGDYPGKFAVGGWGQSGTLKEYWQGAPCSSAICQSGAAGIYADATNRLHTLSRPDGSGIFIGYIQYGINNSKTMLVNEFVGGGITGLGLIPGRTKDTMGFGVANSWTNGPSNKGIGYLPYPGTSKPRTETILQIYYQANVWGDIFVQPTISYVPHPASPMQYDASTKPPSQNFYYYGSSASSFILQLVALF